MKHDTTRSKFGPSKCQFNGCTVSLSNPTPFALICHIGIHSTNKRYTCTGCTYGWAQFHQAYTHTKRCERAANVKDNIDETMLLDWIELGRVCFPDRVDEIQKSGQKQLIKARENENHDPLLSVSDYSFNVKEEMDSDEGNQSLSSPLSATLAAIARIVELPNHCKSEESCSSKSTAETSAVKRKFLKTKDTETASTADVKRFKLHTPSIFTGSWEESPKHECSSCQQKNDLDQMIVCADCNVIICGLCAYKKHKMHDGRELLNEEIYGLAKELSDLIDQKVDQHITPLSNLCNETFELYDEIKAEMYNLKPLVSTQTSWKEANEKAEKCRKMIDAIADVFTEFTAEIQKSNKKLEEKLEKLKAQDFDAIDEKPIADA